jgi:hypothetical protein
VPSSAPADASPVPSVPTPDASGQA